MQGKKLFDFEFWVSNDECFYFFHFYLLPDRYFFSFVQFWEDCILFFLVVLGMCKKVIAVGAHLLLLLLLAS